MEQVNIHEKWAEEKQNYSPVKNGSRGHETGRYSSRLLLLIQQKKSQRKGTSAFLMGKERQLCLTM